MKKHETLDPPGQLAIKVNYQPTRRYQIDFTDSKLMTKQSPKAECDINNIMKKFEKDGILDHFNAHQGDYGDYTTFADYHTSLNQVLDAETMFLSIPSKIRARFDNDAAKFLAFAQDPENLDQMVELGLAKQPVKASPDDAIIPPTEAAKKQAEAVTAPETAP